MAVGFVKQDAAGNSEAIALLFPLLVIGENKSLPS